MASVLGKVSYDELDPELLKVMEEGSVRVLDSKFKILDPKGEYASLGLGKEFTFPDFIKAISAKVKEQNDMHTYIEKFQQSNYERKIELLTRDLTAVKEDNKKYFEKVKKLEEEVKSMTSPQPPPNPGEEDTDKIIYSSDRSDYTVNDYQDSIGISVGGNEIKIPTNMFVSEKRAKETIAKIESVKSHSDGDNEIYKKLENINNSIKTY